MAGGGGTRLWPLSTEARPKQFLPLLSPKSLLAETWERLAPAFPDVWVATSARHAELVARELTQLPPGRILTEPARRNSGPAILAAALRFAAEAIRSRPPCPPTRPSAIPRRFAGRSRRPARSRIEASVVILAVPPTRPETDFGYVEVRDGKVRLVRREARRREGARAGVVRPPSLERRPLRLPSVAAARRGAPGGGRARRGRRALREVGSDGRLRAASRHLDRLRRHGEGRRRCGRAARRGLERRRHLALRSATCAARLPTATSSSPMEVGRSRPGRAGQRHRRRTGRDPGAAVRPRDGAEARRGAPPRRQRQGDGEEAGARNR